LNAAIALNDEPITALGRASSNKLSYIQSVGTAVSLNMLPLKTSRQQCCKWLQALHSRPPDKKFDTLGSMAASEILRKLMSGLEQKTDWRVVVVC
jgi:hypothetical protein